MIESKTYNFSDFCNENKITKNQRGRRMDDLLEWFTNFYDFEFAKGRRGVPHTITIKEIYGKYSPLPRKGVDLAKEKQECAKDFVVN